MIIEKWKVEIVKAFLAKGCPGYAFAALCLLTLSGLASAYMLLRG